MLTFHCPYTQVSCDLASSFCLTFFLLNYANPPLVEAFKECCGKSVFNILMSSFAGCFECHLTFFKQDMRAVGK